MMDFMWKFIIGWDEKEMCGKQGVFGIPIAACESDEEQGCKTLHYSHWLVWIQGFNFVRSMCYHDDEAVKTVARSKLNSYVAKTMCASFGSGYEVSHVCDSGVETTDIVENVFQPLPEQVIRDARHKDHCYTVHGE